MRWIGVLVVLAAIAWYLMQSSESGGKRPPAKVMTAPPTAVAPVATAALTVPVAQPQQNPVQAVYARMQGVAQPLGVQVRNLTPQPGGGVVTVAWTGDVATIGADFLQQCAWQQVIRDFDVEHVNLSKQIEDGRPVWIAQYSVKF